MPTSFRKSTFAFLALFLCLASLVFAGVNQDSYKTTRGTGPELLFDGVSSVTSAAWTTPTNPRYTRGNPSVAVSAESVTAGANVEVMCGLYHKDESDGSFTFLGLSDAVTITFSSDQEVSAGIYTSEDLARFETQGANVIDVRVVAKTATSFDLRVWGYGTEPTLTEAD